MVQTGRRKAVPGHGLWMEQRGQAERMGRGGEGADRWAGVQGDGKGGKGGNAELTLRCYKGKALRDAVGWAARAVGARSWSSGAYLENSVELVVGAIG